MPSGQALPELDALSDACLDLRGPEALPRRTTVEVWIPPSDADLVRRRFGDGSPAGLIEAAGRFRDADCRFDMGPVEETGIYHPCPWGADVAEEQLPGVAGALALLLRDHAGPVGAVAIGEVLNPPDRFGFVTFGGLDEGGARAFAVCTAYVAAGWLPPSSLALEAVQSRRLPDDTPEVVRGAIRTSIEALAVRVDAAIANVSGVDWSPRP